MKSPIPLVDLIGHVGRSDSMKDMSAQRIDRTYAETDASPSKDGGPAIFHVSVVMRIDEVRAWMEQGMVSLERDVMAFSSDDALRQMNIRINRK